MRPTVPLMALLVAGTLAGCLGGGSNPNGNAAAPITDPAVHDVVVVAVIDSGLNPYHFDFLADFMPQILNENKSDDLPLTKDPSTWVPGYPASGSFASFQELNLTLTPKDPKKSVAALHEADASKWANLESSTATEVHMSWMPGTKVIGAVSFGAGDFFSPNSHGVGSSSVSVGNLHGTCPHCLLVFVNGMEEEANDWVAKQPWIDAQTNSWGLSSTGVARDRVYAGSDTNLQRTAVDRGQSIFFSAGNGLVNDFGAPNPTIFSSQEGPDWITTVGAILPDGTTTGSGKPADVSAPGSNYPSAGGAAKTTNSNGTFGGTSNATPVTTGIYAEALYTLRRELVGASRMQEGGVIAKGNVSGCGPANAQCALSDGALTVHELREALFRSANHTGAGYSWGGDATIPTSENQEEVRYMSAGHGSYWGLMKGREAYQRDIARIAGYAAGRWTAVQDPDQVSWFVADSLCRQGGWGAWDHGYAKKGPVPAPHQDWPVRTWLAHTCPTFLAQMVAAEKSAPSFPPLSSAG